MARKTLHGAHIATGRVERGGDGGMAQRMWPDVEPGALPEPLDDGPDPLAGQPTMRRALAARIEAQEQRTGRLATDGDPGLQRAQGGIGQAHRHLLALALADDEETPPDPLDIAQIEPAHLATPQGDVIQQPEKGDIALRLAT